MNSIKAYELLLYFHSNYRWIAILALIVLFIWTYSAKKHQKTYTQKAFRINIQLTSIITIQGIIGLLLYSISPIAQAFWTDVSFYIKERQVRFFGLEHIFMMALGIILLWYNVWRSKMYIGSNNFFKKQLNLYIWIIMIMLSSVPWSFSPLTSRPNYRAYEYSIDR